MTLSARCPECATTFRVTVEQLRAHQGLVRCGLCAAVFNALDSLGPAGAGVTASALPPPATPPPEAATAPPPEKALSEHASERKFDHAESGLIASTPGAPSTEEAFSMPRESQTGALGLPEEDLRAADFDSPPLALEREPPGRLWGAGVVLLLIVLAAQAAFFFRTELAASMPDAHPYLAGLCQTLGCRVGLPERPNLIGIVSSDLRVEQDSVLVLEAVLRNRAPFRQAYPLVELTLTRTGDVPVARRVLQPAEYLPPGPNRDKGIGAGAEFALKLALDSGDLMPTGYQLYVFYR
jgi:predicted Zn finger-like uncharacterized protein